MGNHAKAQRYYGRALAIWEKEFGPDHPNTQFVRESLKSVYSPLLFRFGFFFLPVVLAFAFLFGHSGSVYGIRLWKSSTELIIRMWFTAGLPVVALAMWFCMRFARLVWSRTRFYPGSLEAGYIGSAAMGCGMTEAAVAVNPEYAYVSPLVWVSFIVGFGAILNESILSMLIGVAVAILLTMALGVPDWKALAFNTALLLVLSPILMAMALHILIRARSMLWRIYQE